MEYNMSKILIRMIVIAGLILESVSGLAQGCLITEVAEKPFYFKQAGLINDIYEKVKKTDGHNYEILLINSFGQMNQKEAYHITIDSAEKINITQIVNDSILFSACLSTTSKYLLKRFFIYSMANRYLVSECPNVVSSHTKSLLLAFNHKSKTWVEYISMDGAIKKSFPDNEKYNYLKAGYALIEDICKEFNLKMMK